MFGLAALGLAGQTAGTIRSPTVPLTEGPFYKSGSPERSVLVSSGMQGRRITISGTVFDLSGTPVAGAWLDF